MSEARPPGGSSPVNFEELAELARLVRLAQRVFGAAVSRDLQTCQCSVCKAIRALREPAPQVPQRLVDGADAVANSIAELLRTFGRAVGGTDSSRGSGTGGQVAVGRGTGTGSAADRADSSDAEQPRTAPALEPGGDPWQVATRGAPAAEDAQGPAKGKRSAKGSGSTKAKDAAKAKGTTNAKSSTKSKGAKPGSASPKAGSAAPKDGAKAAKRGPKKPKG